MIRPHVGADAALIAAGQPAGPVSRLPHRFAGARFAPRLPPAAGGGGAAGGPAGPRPGRSAAAAHCGSRAGRCGRGRERRGRPHPLVRPALAGWLSAAGRGGGSPAPVRADAAVAGDHAPAARPGCRRGGGVDRRPQRHLDRRPPARPAAAGADGGAAAAARPPRHGAALDPDRPQFPAALPPPRPGAGAAARGARPACCCRRWPRG